MKPFRVVQFFSEEKLKECKDWPAEAKLRWLENANHLLYQSYISAGHPPPYDPRTWPYLDPEEKTP